MKRNREKNDKKRSRNKENEQERDRIKAKKKETRGREGRNEHSKGDVKRLFPGCFYSVAAPVMQHKQRDLWHCCRVTVHKVIMNPALSGFIDDSQEAISQLHPRIM